VGLQLRHFVLKDFAGDVWPKFVEDTAERTIGRYCKAALEGQPSASIRSRVVEV
jgi:hypothetical protein